MSLPRSADLAVIFAGAATGLPLTSATWTRVRAGGADLTQAVAGILHDVRVEPAPGDRDLDEPRATLAVRATQFTTIAQPAPGDTWGAWEVVAVEKGVLNEIGDGVHLVELAQRVARGTAV